METFLSNFCKSSIPIEWRPTILRNNTYRGVCFSYSALGIFFIYNAHKLSTRGLPIFAQHGWLMLGLLLFFQGYCSYLANYTYAARTSLAHPIDMFLAGILFFTFNYIIAFEYLPPFAKFVSFAGALHGSISLFLSRRYRTINCADVHSFIFWHTSWHSCLPFSVFLMFADCLRQPVPPEHRWYPPHHFAFWLPLVVSVRVGFGPNFGSYPITWHWSMKTPRRRGKLPDWHLDDSCFKCVVSYRIM